MKHIVDILPCQRCGSSLDRNTKPLRCSACCAAIGNGSGVFTTCKESSYYWGEIPHADMIEALSLAKEKGWKESIERLSVRHPRLPQMVTAADRVDWCRLNGQNRMVILDVGSGLGQTSFLLAKDRTNTVVSLELIKERAQFQAIRKEQEQVENLFVVNGDLLDTTFYPNTFDMVQFVGVLEWIGFEEKPSSPREEQLRALRKVREILKPSGLVYIGIENRFSLHSVLGAKDHSGLRFTSLMPRSLADLYMKLRTPIYRSSLAPHSYRTYTYSASGYKELLSEAGFSQADIYMVHPNYNHPRSIIPLDNRMIQRFFSGFYRPRNNIKDRISTGFFRVLSRLGLAAFFAPHYLIVGKN